MSSIYMHLINKKIKIVDFILLIIFICFSFQIHSNNSNKYFQLDQEFEAENSALDKTVDCLNPLYESTAVKFCQKFKKINDEISHYGTLLSEKLLTCSYFQENWLNFLHEAENVNEYYRGMQLFENHTNGFRNTCHYLTTAFNFYTGDYHTPTPQLVEVNFEGENVPAFLNTFKVGRNLSPEERELYFAHEKTCYSGDALSAPFILDASNLNNLQEETIYNFALLPDGTIHVALEEPGNKEYHVHNDVLTTEVFHYPNHTILAGAPHQAVISAGSFIFYRVEGKQLFFTSCKSGHFQPSYDSLIHLNKQLTKLGVHPATIISAPHVDMSQAILKRYNEAQIPLSITVKETENLFQFAFSQWHKIYQKIDRNLLNGLAEGNKQALNLENEGIIHRLRESANHMSSAFTLFTEEHASPKKFRQLVKELGKLRDGIECKAPKKIQKGAKKVLLFLNAYEGELEHLQYSSASDASFYSYMKHLISSMENSLEHDQLNIDDYRFLKKKSRELGVLFHCLSQNLKWKGKGYFIYHNTSKAFFKINKKLAMVQDKYFSNLLHEEMDPETLFHLEIFSKNIEDLKKYLKQLGLLPIQYTIDIDPEVAWWMINSAKDWYLSHTRLHFKHYDDSEVPILTSLFSNITKDNSPKSAFSKELEELKCLKRAAEIARNALIFLDIHHQAPESIHQYIQSISQIIQAIKNDDLEQVKDKANFMLSLSGTPTLALEEWQCCTLDGFLQTLNEHLTCLHQFIYESHISRVQAEEIIEKVQAIQDLMNLFRRNGLSKNEKLPMICYDSLEEHAEVLIKEIQEALLNLKKDDKEFTTTPSMFYHAQFMLSRVSTNSAKYSLEP